MRTIALVLVLFVATVGSGSAASTNGVIKLVSSSHQDTAWMDTPDACRAFRIEHNILPALEMMRKDPRYTFCMECALHLMEFLEAHPERRDEVARRMQEGRLEFGATYNQPYEDYLSGEELIRQIYYGRRWIKKNFPGCDARVAFNPDVPARSLQMQQILAKSGVPYLFISRYHEGLYRWASPDGSAVVAYTPGHYGNHLGLLNDSPSNGVRALRDYLPPRQAYNRQWGAPQVFCLINSGDFSKPADFAPLIAAWNSQPDADRNPRMEYSSIVGYFDALNRPGAGFNNIAGARPNVWLYITGATHHWTASARREAARLLVEAETFCAVDGLLKGDFKDYPKRELDEAWKDELYIDHGIGGKNGHITDAVFHKKAEQAVRTAAGIRSLALQNMARRVQADSKLGQPLVVVNGLSWRRDGIGSAEPVAHKVRVVDAGGREVPSQVTSLGAADEVNVALASAGAKAWADSEYNADYGAMNAIDGRWDVRDPDKTLGKPAKWNSNGAAGDKWLVIDFGKPRTLHKVVIRHEGVMGAFQAETVHNTSDFRVQGAGSAEGPWADLVPPVTGSRDTLTVHEFDARPVRCLRIYISKGTQGPDPTARLYEVEAFERKDAKPSQVRFVAKDVPSIGYKTYYLVKDERREPAGPGPDVPFAGEAGNEFYRVKFVPGGVTSIYDKQLRRELLRPGRLLGGEVFTMTSPLPGQRGAGTDAGEFGAVPQPGLDETFDKVAAHGPQWKRIEAGPVFSAYGLEQKMADCLVRQRLILWHQIKRIDFEVDLEHFNGRLWREYRMALPLAMQAPQVTYEVPMGVVRIGKDEVPTTGGHAYGRLNYGELCKDIRPREVQNFIDVSDGQGGVTISSEVTSFDWQDVTDTNHTGVVIQPILLATRKSCNGEGNWYPQAGDHRYRFSITSHAGDWRNGWKAGIEANVGLSTVSPAEPGEAKKTLPAERSFFSVSGSNVVISTVKKAEDDDDVVVRCYDLEGKDSTVTLTGPVRVKKALRTDMIEEGGKKLKVRNNSVLFPVGHHAIETVKLSVNEKTGSAPARRGR